MTSNASTSTDVAPAPTDVREDIARAIYTAQAKVIGVKESWDELKTLAESQPWQKASLDFIYASADAVVPRIAQARRDGAEVERERAWSIVDAEARTCDACADSEDYLGHDNEKWLYAARKLHEVAAAIRARSNPSGDRT